jgi:hypothetical protein
MSSYDIDTAIANHVAWRQQFQTAIEGVDADKLGELDISDHAACQFGRWLMAPAQASLHDRPDFGDLFSAHERFHQVASEIIDCLHEAKVDEAQALLDSRFVEVSAILVELLAATRTQVGLR